MRETPVQQTGHERDPAAWQTIDNELPSKEAADRIIKMRKHGNSVVCPSPLFETLELRTVKSDVPGLWAIEARPEVRQPSVVLGDGDMDGALAPWMDDRVATNGLPIKENFNAWFAGSKVVNDNGEPKVVFHGTHKEFDVFKPSPSGTYGPGIYFADTDSSAAEYGATRVVEAFLNLKNPWIVSADYGSEAAQVEEIDSPLVDDLLLLPTGRRLLNIAKINEFGHFGQALQDQLVKLGHDGIVATYPDGSKEIVAFRPEQVKCAKTNSGLYSNSDSDITDRLVESATAARYYVASVALKKVDLCA